MLEKIILAVILIRRHFRFAMATSSKWPAKHYVYLVQKAVECISNAHVLVFSSSQDSEISYDQFSYAGSPALQYRTLLQAGAKPDSCDIVVVNDTGFAHNLSDGRKWNVWCDYQRLPLHITAQDKAAVREHYCRAGAYGN